ncbi:MAG: beta-galactosidase [Clostridia bacterium]|nr:beta-galactosidase [Clostridia bacterium]
MSLLNFKNKMSYLDDEPFYIISGDIHYFRIYPGGLKRRLELMKAFGLNTVQTYVPWNLHEPEKGQFNFEGLCDLEGFLKLLDEVGLKCFLRPSPYICSEWDKGGLPYWLGKEKMALRTHDERYMKHVKDYYDVLCPKFIPYLSTNGGPVIAVTVENEYGSYGNDSIYMKQLADMLVERGVDVPLYTSDGTCDFMMKFGLIDGIWGGFNYRLASADTIRIAREQRPDFPPLLPEYWSGRAVHKGEPYCPRNVKEVADGYEEALKNGGMLNFYMFTGGTNFGFLNGANFGKTFNAPTDAVNKYIPITTSYDVDALINEQGLPTEKYFECRKRLWKYLGQPEPPMPTLDYSVQKPDDVNLDSVAYLFDNLDNFKCIKSVVPMTFEELDQDYGYVLYRTYADGFGDGGEFTMPNPRDRVDVYANGELKGTVMRDRGSNTVIIDTTKGEKVKLELLVENCGRINYGYRIAEQKGLPDGVLYSIAQLYNWENISLSFKSLEGLKYTKDFGKKGPAFYKGNFKAKPDTDTFLDMRNFNKGFVFVNGFNLGRYWNAGPQYTLYVPGELLKEENVIEIFEQYEAPKDLKVKFTDKAIIK